MMMFYYEFRNIKTQEIFSCAAPCFANACRQLGQKPIDCRVVWKADLGNMPT
jgi:hypothetical protein